MGFYTIACTWEMYGKTVVEADNLDDAIRIVESEDFPLPNDAVYLARGIPIGRVRSPRPVNQFRVGGVHGTFAVDRDTLE